ncbi:N-acetyltransferase [Pseudoalteromonas phenolica]|uniref:N-acetyltransferase n=1 Tax=Pseudoalteromonas phenolica TaxID=161398 RepID=A0A5R9PXZ6_9GAMM|nr:GNAT family N-acetyltransferase [Pseudoalteromonas phenolica]TLX45535.1 N-acetyltransferase [Pseudoalteromonas phenolica]
MDIKLIADNNWNDILAIQAKAYHEVDSETLDVLKSKQTASPETCFVCVSEQNEALGYLLAHPWGESEPPKLFVPLLDTINSQTLYLHDMAVSPYSKGQGIGRAMVAKLIEVAKAKGFKRITLVAIQGADSFWSSLGFKLIVGANISSTYGENAVFMEMEVVA